MLKKIALTLFLELHKQAQESNDRHAYSEFS